MQMERKRLNEYEFLYDRDSFTMNSTLESMYKALQDVDDNNYVFVQAILQQNKLLQEQMEELREQITNMDLKINYLLDNSK